MPDPAVPGGRTLEFTDLPLIEVALKRVPRSPFPVSLPFVLQLKSEVEGRFDQILDLDVLERPPGPVPAVAYAAHTTNGCRLIDSKSGLSVNLQPDMLVVRWAISEGRDYPRFAAMRETADYVTAAVERVGLQRFEPALVNMAYANRVDASIDSGRPRPHPWPLAESWTPSSLRDEGQALESQSVFRGLDRVDRRVVVQYREEAPDGAPWYLLLTIAGKPVGDDEDLDQAENRVHEALIEWFPRLLSKEAMLAYGLQI